MTTKRNRVSAVTAMIVEPLSVVSSSAIQIHQWWEQNPNSLLLMAETGSSYSLASYYTSLGLFVISVPGLWSLIKRSVKSKVRTLRIIKTLNFSSISSILRASLNPMWGFADSEKDVCC